MPTGWDVYYVVFLSAVLALGLPASLKFLSLWISKKSSDPGTPRPSRSGFTSKAGETSLGQRINARFFLAANAALVLIALTLVLIPCATTLAGGTSVEVIWGLISIVSIALFAGLGLLYSARKGDLSWLGSFDTEKSRKS